LEKTKKIPACNENAVSFIDLQQLAVELRSCDYLVVLHSTAQDDPRVGDQSGNTKLPGFPTRAIIEMFPEVASLFGGFSILIYLLICFLELYELDASVDTIT
jgi:hypothetical protein